MLGVLSYLGNRLFSFPPEDVDYFLPQLIVLYVHNANIAEAIYPYLVSRCRTSVYTSLHIIWLLNAFCPDIVSASSSHVRKPKSHGAKLRNLILSEELRVHSTTRRSDKVTTSAAQGRRTCPSALALSKSNASSSQHHHRTHYRSFSDATCGPGNINGSNGLSTLAPNGGHRNGGATLRLPTASNNAFHLSPHHHRRSSVICLEKVLGDLSSGHAFDNGCTCFMEQCHHLNSTVPCDQQLSSEAAAAAAAEVCLVDCHCGAPRIKPQYEFIRCLMNIGKFIRDFEHHN